MGEGTDAARAAVLTARGSVDDELDRLEASARAAVDGKAKIKRNPGRTAGLAAGAGFILLGGPRRVLRGGRNLVFGKPDPLPKSMLPKEIDKAIRELGDDGEKVRGTIEREFADYLKEHGQARRSRDLSGVLALILASVGRPVADRYGRRLLEQLIDPEAGSFREQMEKIRARRAAMSAEAGATATTPAGAQRPGTPGPPATPSA